MVRAFHARVISGQMPLSTEVTRLWQIAIYEKDQDVVEEGGYFPIAVLWRKSEASETQ